MTSAQIPQRKGPSGPRASSGITGPTGPTGSTGAAGVTGPTGPTGSSSGQTTIGITWSASSDDDVATFDFTSALPLLANGEHYVGIVGRASNLAVQLFGQITVLDGALVFPNALSGTNGIETTRFVGLANPLITTNWDVAIDIESSPALLIVFAAPE